MKPLRTPGSDVTLTLAGGTEDNELPAQRILVYNADLGETEKDARVAFESLWMPDEAEARKLEAGAAVCLRVWALRTEEGGYTQPPVSVGVTDSVLPERELVDRGTVDNAVGQLYGALKERKTGHGHVGGLEIPEGMTLITLPEPGAFVDMWIAAMKAATEAKDGVAPASNGTPGSAGDASAAAADDPIEGDDLSPQDFVAGIKLLVGDTTVDVDSLPDGLTMVRTKAHGRDVMAQGRTRRSILARLRKAVEEAAVDSEHMQGEEG